MFTYNANPRSASAEWRAIARPQLPVPIQPAAGSVREKDGAAARWRKKNKS